MADVNFEKAAEDVKNLKETPNDKELLELYALFKQSKEGDVTTERPSLFKLKDKAKWDAWNDKKGLPSSKAKEEYVALANKLITTYGLK